MKSSPKLSRLTDKENQWIQQHLQLVPTFVEAYASDAQGDDITLDVLDRAFAAWIASGPKDGAETNHTINLFGVTFGQFLVDDAGFEWVIAADDLGTDLAVVALPGKGDVLVYPANFVAKRWERRETGFLAPSFDAMKQQVAEVQAKSQTPPTKRSRWKLW